MPIYKYKEWLPVNKTVLSVISIGLLLSACSAAPAPSAPLPPGSDAPTSSSESSEFSSLESSSAISSSINSSTDGENKELLDKLAISADFDIPIDGEQRVIVHVTNNSDKTFTGNIHVNIEDSAGKNLVSDMVIVESLKPGQSTFANVFSEPNGNPVFSYEISKDFLFDDAGIADGVGAKDDALSKEIFDDFMLSFGGTTWGPDITDISIFSDGASYWAEVTISSIENSENIQNITFANLKVGDSRVSKVIVKDSTGTQIGLKVR